MKNGHDATVRYHAEMTAPCKIYTLTRLLAD